MLEVLGMQVRFHDFHVLPRLEETIDLRIIYAAREGVAMVSLFGAYDRDKLAGDPFEFLARVGADGLLCGNANLRVLLSKVVGRVVLLELF